MKSIIPFILLIISAEALSQCEYAVDDSIVELIGVPDVMPVPEGGLDNYLAWLNTNNRLFESSDTLTARDRVFIEVMVDTTGALVNKLILKGIGIPYDTEACRLVSECPINWLPGSNRGRKIKYPVLIPILFSGKPLEQ
jgi:hypothetical protein